MSFQYFSGEVRGLRGPGLTSAQQADLDAAVAFIPAALLKEGVAAEGTGYVDLVQSQMKNARAAVDPFDLARFDQLMAVASRIDVVAAQAIGLNYMDPVQYSPIPNYLQPGYSPQSFAYSSPAGGFGSIGIIIPPQTAGAVVRVFLEQRTRVGDTPEIGLFGSGGSMEGTVQALADVEAGMVEYVFMVPAGQVATAIEFRTNSIAPAANSGDVFVIVNGGAQRTIGGVLEDLEGRVDEIAKPAVQGSWYLRNFSQDAMALKLGWLAQIKKILIGDSWTDGLPYFADAYLRRMRAEFEASGNGAGAGYVGFAWDQVNANNTQAHKNIDIDVLVSYSGAITSTYKGSPLPDLGYVTATTIGDKVSVTLPATDNSNAATLWSPGSSGNVRYRWKNGAWTAVDLSAAGLLVKDLVGITPGGGLLEIEATSANAKIGGVRFTGNGAGVRIEKFGVSGSTIPDFLAVDAEQWQLGMEKIGPRTVQIMFFTNDRVISKPAEFGANMTQLVGRIRTAAPYADIEIVMPPENDVGGTYPQSQYAAAARRVAYALGCAFIDLQYVFGGHPDTYDWASPQKLLDASGAHPTQDAGSHRIVGAVLRMELGRP